MKTSHAERFPQNTASKHQGRPANNPVNRDNRFTNKELENETVKLMLRPRLWPRTLSLPIWSVTSARDQARTKCKTPNSLSKLPEGTKILKEKHY